MKILPAYFYRTSAGREPVRDFITALGKPDSTIIGYDVKTVEMGWPVGMPVCRSLEDGLWEVRSNISSGRIVRTIFCIYDGRMCLLHAFIKKTQQTPKSDLELAKQRKTDLMRGGI